MGAAMLHLMIVAILLLMIVVMLVMQRIEEDIIKRYHPQSGTDLDKSGGMPSAPGSKPVALSLQDQQFLFGLNRFSCLHEPVDTLNAAKPETAITPSIVFPDDFRSESKPEWAIAARAAELHAFTLWRIIVRD